MSLIVFLPFILPDEENAEQFITDDMQVVVIALVSCTSLINMKVGSLL
jgi:hypothetical protein